ncbi:hypothetical protein M513_07953 [Trichuris suis]|uniref:Uncharacterized protein n=1 Tax=Trichuris suis TaxID=68888 RepID=A0A085M1U3_9BILA|nr:hypothetical protein M513_07953 [Trichuris suis]
MRSKRYVRTGCTASPRALARPESVGNPGFLVAAAANPFTDTTSVKWTPRGPLELRNLHFSHFLAKLQYDCWAADRKDPSFLMTRTALLYGQASVADSIGQFRIAKR